MFSSNRGIIDFIAKFIDRWRSFWHKLTWMQTGTSYDKIGWSDNLPKLYLGNTVQIPTLSIEDKEFY